MRRHLGAAWSLAALATLAGCSTVDDLAPMSGTSLSSAAAMVATAHPRFGDNDPHDWVAANAPATYPVHGTDVSKYQREVDWAEARNSGISFAFVKATEGGDRLDDRFMQHWRGAQAAGVPRAAYHFYYFCRSAADQARWFIRNVPKERGALPPVLDMEWNPDSPTCKKRPDAQTVQSEMRVWLQMVERHYGQKPIIYTSIDFYEDNKLAAFQGYPYWLRSVAGHPSSRYGGQDWTFWQYTGTGVVPGIKGNTDINVFNGSTAAWKKWVQANSG